MEAVSKQEFTQSMNRIDKRFTGIDKRFDAVDKRFDSIDKRFDGVDKRLDAVEQTIHDEIHGLAAMITKGFADLEKRLDVKERVDTLEKKMTKVETALNVRL